MKSINGIVLTLAALAAAVPAYADEAAKQLAENLLTAEVELGALIVTDELTVEEVYQAILANGENEIGAITAILDANPSADDFKTIVAAAVSQNPAAAESIVASSLSRIGTLASELSDAQHFALIQSTVSGAVEAAPAQVAAITNNAVEALGGAASEPESVQAVVQAAIIAAPQEAAAVVESVIQSIGGAGASTELVAATIESAVAVKVDTTQQIVQAAVVALGGSKTSEEMINTVVKATVDGAADASGANTRGAESTETQVVVLNGGADEQTVEAAIAAATQAVINATGGDSIITSNAVGAMLSKLEVTENSESNVTETVIAVAAATGGDVLSLVRQAATESGIEPAGSIVAQNGASGEQQEGTTEEQGETGDPVGENTGTEPAATETGTTVAGGEGSTTDTGTSNSTGTGTATATGTTTGTRPSSGGTTRPTTGGRPASPAT